MENDDIISGFDDEKDESLSIKLKEVDELEHCLQLSLTGYIDTYNSNFFQKQVQRVIDEGYTRLIFHCGGLNYVSSTGIGSFTAFLKNVKPLGGDVVLLEVQPKVFEVFQLLGFAQFFNIKDTLEDSLGVFGGQLTAEILDELFPLVFSCPICSKKLKALKPGRFRCSECKSVLAVSDSGQASLG
ncbi:MAG: STAS domain-containing protein [Treponema sp.]|jgi:anti-anti-sigma factor|nr:STAS domain-containing protein [Treponema sp.]